MNDFFAGKRKELAKVKGEGNITGKHMHPMTTYGDLLYEFCYYSRCLKKSKDNYITQQRNNELKKKTLDAANMVRSTNDDS